MRTRIVPHIEPIAIALLTAIATTVVASAVVTAQAPTTQELTIFVKEQQTFAPGYPVGNIAIGDPAVADFKVMPGRRELLLFGKGKGETRLTLWDQKGVKRHEVQIKVGVREEVAAESDLRTLLKPFPTVEVSKLGAQTVVTGTVSTDADMDAVSRIAAAANAQNLVRLVKGSAIGAVVGPVGPTGPSSPGGTTSPGGTAGSTAPAQVEYEVELLEAHVAFASGTYGVGIEPSGRTLYKQVVRVPFNTDSDVTIPGSAALPQRADNRLKQAANLKMRIKPTALSEEGELTTFVAIETNVPVEGSKDPSVMRRARWELVSKSDEPFGLGGAELMAMPQVARGSSKLGRILATASGTAGLAGNVPGASGYTGYVPSYLPYYDKDKKTQLLAVFRPRLVRPAAK